MTDVSTRLRVLWLTQVVPYPPTGGSLQRAYHLLKGLGAQHDVHLIAMQHKPMSAALLAEAREALAPFCQAIDIVDISAAASGPGMLSLALLSLLTGFPMSVAIFRSRRFRQLVRQALRAQPFDVAHVDTISVADYIKDVAALPTVMAHIGAESYMIRRRIPQERSWLRRLFFRHEAVSLERYERATCSQVGMNLVVSELDRELLQPVAPDAAFALVENGTDIDFFRPVARSAGKRLIFAGRLDQASNRDGLRWFLRTTWPLICSRHPDVSLDIVGPNPPADVVRAGAEDPRITVHGLVPDVRTYFAAATAVISPLRDGGGTRLKILDALAMGMPLVATAVACEGIDVVPEHDVLIANTPDEFADQIDRLFADPTLRDHLAAHGRALIETRYSWDQLVAKLIGVYRTLLASRAAVPNSRALLAEASSIERADAGKRAKGIQPV
jgi:polysaccharide biosynthesis protein PslH